MPGIVGLIGSSKAPAQCERLVQAMASSMMHEEFYVSGIHATSELKVYTAWVAHKDSGSASQPYVHDSGNLILLLSGELFCEGGATISGTETNSGQVSSTFLRPYAEKGERCFAELNGSFGGLLINRSQGKVFLFNDRYGMERIYWHQTEDGFYFASEAKALLCVLPQLRCLDEEGAAQFLAFGCTLGSRTLFRGIEIMPPASQWTFQEGKISKKKYFLPDLWESQAPLLPDAFAEQFTATFQNLLPQYLQANAGLGISLTGGLDSRLIMAGLGDLDSNPVCYTFSGKDETVLDATIAARVAAVSGLDHHVLRLRDEFFEEFSSYADRTVYISDGTVSVFGAHELYLNQQARQLAPVRLTGVFGGEVMRGVSFFKPLRLAKKLLDPAIQKKIALIEQGQLASQQHPITYAAFTETPQKRYGPPAVARSQVTFRTPFLDNDFVALCYRRPPAAEDPAAAALRFVRDRNPALAGIPTDRGYVNGRRTLSAKLVAETLFKLDYYCSEGLPRRFTPIDSAFRSAASSLGISGRYKFIKYGSWLRGKLARYLNERALDLKNVKSQLWQSASAESIIGDHLSGRANHAYEIGSMLTLEAVERLLLGTT